MASTTPTDSSTTASGSEQPPTSPLLGSVLSLSKVDAALARLKSQRVKLSKDLASREDQLKKNESLFAQRSKVVSDKKGHYSRDEKEIRFEQEKLTERRKALSSVGTYKTQQAANREIEHLGRQLLAREEVMLSSLGEIEKLEKECAEIAKVIATQKGELETVRKEAQEQLRGFDDREKELFVEREKLVPLVDKVNLTTYERIKERFPTDPVAGVKGGICSGCFVQVVPQLIVQSLKGDALIKCRGCGRIIFIDTAAEEGKTK